MKKIKKYKLECEISHDYFLIGIHSVLEDYRLAYFLNEAFSIQLKKKKDNIEFSKKEGSFSNFDYEDISTYCYWSLVNNKQIKEQAVSKDSFHLFEEIFNTYILIPEKKNIDFFLKIEGDFDATKIVEITKKINTIHQVITTYQMNPNHLKSKDFLIF